MIGPESGVFEARRRLDGIGVVGIRWVLCRRFGWIRAVTIRLRHERRRIVMWLDAFRDVPGRVVSSIDVGSAL